MKIFKNLISIFIIFLILLNHNTISLAEQKINNPYLDKLKDKDNIKTSDTNIQFDLSKQREDYILSPQDKIQIIIFSTVESQVGKEPWGKIETTIIIGPDGKADLPVLGEVTIAGLTISELRKKLVDALSNIIIKPNVIINLLESNIFIYVLGEVRYAGTYKLREKKKVNILEAIALAGGFTENADKSHIELIQYRGNKIIQTQVDLIKILGEGTIDTIYIIPGDTIFVYSSWTSEISKYHGVFSLISTSITLITFILYLTGVR